MGKLRNENTVSILPVMLFTWDWSVRLRNRFLTLTIMLSAVFVANSATAFAVDQPRLPLPYLGNAGQVITVVANRANATTAMLIAWQHSSSGWHRAIGPVTAFVGSQGIGTASESSTRTPAGVWTLTEAFGIQPNNGTRLPYRQVSESDWWVSDVKSPYYNKYLHCRPGACPFNEGAGENLGQAGHVYDHAVVIDYNRNPIKPGAGSAFFLHISGGKPTAGCVAIPETTLNAVMRWLDPKQKPVIDIGVAS